MALRIEPAHRQGRILVVHADRKAQRLLHRTLSASQCPVEIVDLDDAVRQAADDPAVVVVVEQPTARARLELVRQPALGWIAVPPDDASPARPEIVVELLAAGWRHVVGAPLARAGGELLATVQKLIHGDVFGLEKYVGWSAAVRALILEDAADRVGAVEALVEGLARAGLSDRAASLASVIADELLANAIFDAPAPTRGSGRRACETGRLDARPLVGRDVVRLRWATDARFLAVEVTDHWGSLDPAAPGPAIARASQRSAGDLDGGMGLALAYACCNQLVLGVAPGHHAQAIALLDVGTRPTELGRAPSFHLFVENPGWYTQYTPYQAEISQGRLEALLNFQTMIADLTGLPLANASLLDEATAAAEAMNLCVEAADRKRLVFWAAADCHPQTIAVVRRAPKALGIEVVVGDHDVDFEFDRRRLRRAGAVPDDRRRVHDYARLREKATTPGALVVVAADLLALTVLTSPGEHGADVAVGSAQRFGVPMGFGGPHAAFFATSDAHKRFLPGRIIGVSKDAAGRPALRMALQTREQHIRREKATSNICTAQVLLAIMAGMYAVYHGPEGLRAIARACTAPRASWRGPRASWATTLADEPFFDTLRVVMDGARTADDVLRAAGARGINLRAIDGDGSVGVALDETVGRARRRRPARGLRAGSAVKTDARPRARAAEGAIPSPHARTSAYLTHPVFHSYHSETRDAALHQAPRGGATCR